MHVHSLCFLEEMHVLQHACAACMLPSFEENHWKQAKNGSKQHQHASAPLAHHFPRCTSLRFPIHLNDSHTYPHECYEIFPSLSIFLAWPQIFLALHLSPSFLLGLSRPSCLPQLSGGLRHPGSSWRCGTRQPMMHARVGWGEHSGTR